MGSLMETTPELIARAAAHPDRLALAVGDDGFSYGQLLEDSSHAASTLLGDLEDMEERRVVVLAEPGYGYVVTQWATWRAGGAFVPLGTSLPDPEISYALDDATPSVAVADERFAERLEPLAAERGIRFLHAQELMRPAHETSLPSIPDTRASMMLYTSGTTGRPKGVVHTHASVAAQIRSLTRAWAWDADDRILLVLPLHHVHGIVNVLGCALWMGATCEVLPAFDAGRVWARIASGDLTLFMAVPTIYRRLIDHWGGADEERQRVMSEGAAQMRLMVSGSAALPVPTLERWRELTSHTLLERYGMTEIGMALSNSLDDRVPGHVGWPLPGMEVRVVGEHGREVPPGDAGEIQVRGANLFREYWNRPDATKEAFVDGWFKTGDVAVIDESGYRILGRASVDIIKTGGEKVSALEVEDVLRTHPAVKDCAVVGVPDEEWGERVCAAIVPSAEADLSDPEILRAWGKERLAAFKVPRDFLAVEELPRNALGKVTKRQVVELFTPAARSS